MERQVEIAIKIKVRVPASAKAELVQSVLAPLNVQHVSYNYSVDVIDVLNPLDDKAEAIRARFRNGSCSLIEAVKEIRSLFLNTSDGRGTLKGAKDYAEGTI